MKSALQLLAILSLLALGTAARPAVFASGNVGQPRWTVQHSPTKSPLDDISCVSSTECFAAGTGVIVKTADGGKTWKVVQNPYSASHPLKTFESVRCPSPGVCSVVVEPNVIMSTTDGGRTWTHHAIKLPASLGNLGPIACPVVATCYVTAVLSGDTETWFNRSPAIYKTSDGGTTWRSLTIPPSVPCPGDCNNRPVGYPLDWISCQNANQCRAGGDTFIGSHEGYTSAVIRTDDGGKTWKLVHHSFDPNIGTCPTASICTGIYYLPTSPTYGPNLMRTTNGGAAWSSKPISPVLESVACTGKDFCELAGLKGKLAMAIDARLFVQKSPTTDTLAAIACPARDACYAVGAGGVIVARLR